MRTRIPSSLALIVLMAAGCAGYGTIGGGPSDGGMGSDNGGKDGGMMPPPDGGGHYGCTADNDCPPGTHCDTSNGQCVPDPWDGGGPMCDGGTPPGCMDDSQCPDGDYCDGSSGQCLMGCRSNASCGCGNVCTDHACAPGCGSDTDCCSGDVCQNGQCVTPQPPGDGGTGGCSSNADCPEGDVCQNGQCVCDEGGGGDGGTGGGGGGLTCEAGKTLLCHYPPGHPENRHSICVGDPSVPAHERHGDTLGACP